MQRPKYVNSLNLLLTGSLESIERDECHEYSLLLEVSDLVSVLYRLRHAGSRRNFSTLDLIHSVRH